MSKPMYVGRPLFVAVALLLLSGCQQADSPASPATAITKDPVVVYAAYAEHSHLPALFEEYTRETGVLVIVRTGVRATIVDDVIANRIEPPADLLLTYSVNGVWRAADEGALRPLQSAAVPARVAAWLRDADDFWTAISFRRAALVYDPDQVDAADLSDPQVLASPRFKGKLCLASVQESISGAVIAQWINQSGVRDTELIVRNWVANLAVPVFESEPEVLDAIAAGRCEVGLVSSDTVAAADTAYASVDPITLYADIEGIGIARHARNPGGARALVEWLLNDAAQRQPLAAVFAHAAATETQDPANVGRVAYYREDALKLAERARYR